ncbi:PA domain-containing protein [Roseovarius sp.]|uniref:LVIVD repeat-containing protein n=1 Tax=Roseovarius sp. TaxID=1486281 RepID=UPI003A9824CC
MIPKWLYILPVAFSTAALPVWADDHPEISDEFIGILERPDPSEALSHHDLAVKNIVSSGPNSKVTKNLAEAGRGERLLPEGTTDVWVHDGFAYIGTFNSPCGDGTGANGSGVQIFYARNPSKPYQISVIPSPEGSRSNDVKVASMNSGDILVHSNESCGGGPGGFEVYNVDDPEFPQPLASVRIDEINALSNLVFGGITDVGVHNLWLFSQGSNDYVGVVAETAFDNFMIYDITDPANPVRVSAWGAEEIFDPGVGDEVADVSRVLNSALWLLDGFGASANRFLHDVTINKAGDKAYLSNWDAGLVLIDISDPANPAFVSQAIDVANGSLDGEVNSHNAWPNADGTVVVETEEDFSAWESNIPPTSLTQDGGATPGDPTIPATAISTSAGDFFETNQTGLSGSVSGGQVVVDGGPTFAAVELGTAAGSPTFSDTGTLSGELVFIGRACTLTAGDALLNVGAIDPGDIAVVRRGACEFDEKSQSAAAAGASAVVIANNQPGSTPWGGIRIWDYSDPANPVLSSLFDTECSASTEPGGECDPRGTYSVHNVQVEGEKAYVSWYSDGMVVLDISDPVNPVETARFKRSGPEFEAENGGIQDIWGVYKETNSPWIFGSDRNGGLYVLKEYGSGSIKVAQD